MLFFISVFGADHLVLDNKLAYASLGTLVSPTLSIPWLSVIVLSVGLRSYGLFPVHTVVLIQLRCRQLYERDFMEVASALLGDSLTPNSLILCVLQSFCSPLL